MYLFVVSGSKAQRFQPHRNEFWSGTVCQKKGFCAFPSTQKNGSQILSRPLLLFALNSCYPDKKQNKVFFRELQNEWGQTLRLLQ
jgi:hypothetical protein